MVFIPLVEDVWSYNLEKNNDNLVLVFIEKPQEPKIINKINIAGNAITKDKTIRSKLVIEPGDYYNEFLVKNSLSNFNLELWRVLMKAYNFQALTINPKNVNPLD